MEPPIIRLKTLIFNILHEPMPPSFEPLRPGGLVAVIDFAPRQELPPVEGAPKNHIEHGVAASVLIKELHSAGFEILTREQNWPDHDYCVIARKPVAPN
jgi:hypothetical protein